MTEGADDFALTCTPVWFDFHEELLRTLGRERGFGRDLLEVEVLKPGRTGRLFTLFNNHRG